MYRERGPTEEKARLGPPPRWLKCPRKGQVIGGKFIPFKTPLCDLYDDQVLEQYRFYPKMIFGSFQTEKMKIGLWIDLTNTDRFYSKEEVEIEGAHYTKVNLRGHGEAPNQEQTEAFLQICRQFNADHPKQLIAIHCTHGFNRTGFLIAAYLVTERDWSIEAAVTEFAKARPPGIYKQEYLEELFTRYGDKEDTPTAPELPSWSNESVLSLNDDEAANPNGPGPSNRPSTSKPAGPFMDGAIPVVTVVRDVGRMRKLQKQAQELCKWKKQGFPGSQPVSMTTDNLRFISERPYKLSWKADGVRYMMLIVGKDEVYMFDRDHNVYHVPHLLFPHPQDMNKNLKCTLLDGEMIIDVVDDQKLPKFLIYDIVHFEDKPMMGRDFDKRLGYIQNFVVEVRNRAMREGIFDKTTQPFSVRLKEFWEIKYIEKLFSEDFKKNFAHELDGLVFQPCDEGYIPGRCSSVLKWKPPSLNSVDFKLIVRKEKREGMLPEWVGYLHVLHLDTPFGQMKVTKSLMQYDKKIIECSVDKGKWVFMRERTDKSYPNAYTTACGVMHSINNPITEECLINFVKTKGFGLAAVPGDKRSVDGEKKSNGLHQPYATQ